jgi:hypothetical protein
MHTLFKGLTCCAALVAAHSLVVQAATRTAADCSAAAVQAAINASVNGDTVLVPAGNCTWSTAVTIENKAITLKGAGSGAGGTKITYGGTNHTLIRIDAGNNTGKVDVSGFWLVGGDANYWDGTAMQAYGPTGWKNLRIHHMVFESNANWSVKLGADTYGLMDHCTFRGRAFGVMTYGRGALDWSSPLTLGTADFFFFEDNIFDFSDFYNTTGVPILDMDDGGRVVFRHNTIRYGMWETHDKARSGLVSAHAYEIYNNDFWTNTNKWKALDISAGTGVIWGNTFTGPYQVPIGGIDYKSFDPRSVRLCDGTDPADQNVPGESGWRCQYQIGSHKEGAAAIGFPLYLWNNRANGTAVGMVVTDGANHVKANRDYFNSSSAKAGYTPYRYPHPLQAGSFAPPTPPTNVRVVK